MNISFVVGFSRPAVRAYSLNKYIPMIARVLRDLKLRKISIGRKSETILPVARCYFVSLALFFASSLVEQREIKRDC